MLEIKLAEKCNGLLRNFACFLQEVVRFIKLHTERGSKAKLEYHCTRVYTGCPRRNGQNFGRVFLMLSYTDITQNGYGDNGQRNLKL